VRIQLICGQRFGSDQTEEDWQEGQAIEKAEEDDEEEDAEEGDEDEGG